MTRLKSSISIERGKVFEEFISQVLEKDLGLDVLRNVYIADLDKCKVHEIDVLLLARGIVYCIECKNYSGKVIGGLCNTYWSVYYDSGMYYKVYSPVFQNKKHVELLRSLLSSKVLPQSKVYDLLYPVSCTGQRKIPKDFNCVSEKVDFYNNVLNNIIIKDLVLFPDDTDLWVNRCEGIVEKVSEFVDEAEGLMPLEDRRVYEFLSLYKHNSSGLQEMLQRTIRGYEPTKEELILLSNGGIG